MRKSFTLIELIFVIVIIGLLTVIAIPKFSNLTAHAKEASINKIVTSVDLSIEHIHSQWLVNEDFVWDADGDGKSDLNSNGYPDKLDSGAGESKLFKYVLKVPVNACASSSSINCWNEYKNEKYEYKFSSDKKLRVEYNETGGLLECINGIGVNKNQCEEIIY